MAKKSTARKPTKRTATSTKPAAAKGAKGLQALLKQLAALGSESMRKHNAKWGAGENQYGAKHGDIRALAKQDKGDAPLANALWETGNLDAQLLAVLWFKPKELTAREMDRLVRSISCAPVAEWLISYVVKQHADKETLRQQWMAEDDLTAGGQWAARAGWSLTAERVAKSPEGLAVPALLDRIEREMGPADPAVQWTMNAALAEIGIHFPQHRLRAIAIGEKLGIYRDYPVSKGCTSPFAPIWINAMVSRKK